MLGWLRTAAEDGGASLYDVSAGWQAQPLRALRVRVNSPPAAEWSIHEVRLYDGSQSVRPSPDWTLSGWPVARPDSFRISRLKSP